MILYIFHPRFLISIRVDPDAQTAVRYRNLLDFLIAG